MAIQMDKTSIIVCSVIGSLGLLSAILGFSAEGTKLTVSTADLTAVSCLSFFSLDQLANVIDIVTTLALACLTDGSMNSARSRSTHIYAAIYHTGVRRRLPLPAEPGDRARDLRRHLPGGGSDHLLGGGRLLRLLQVPRHPFGDQKDRQHRLRRFLMVSSTYIL
jgi:hypothetical protein